MYPKKKKSHITPFTWYQAALFALLIVSSGFLGGLCLSAVKRNNGIKDFGTLIKGHGGMLDRMDSLCFSAPAFFYLVQAFCKAFWQTSPLKVHMTHRAVRNHFEVLPAA